MSATSKQSLAVVIIMAAHLLSCSSTGNAPRPGSPAFEWTAAKDAFTAGDYDKTTKHLDRIVLTDNEYTARAQALLMVMTSGVARGYMDLANSFDSGARSKKADPGRFRRQASVYRSAASPLCLRFAETFIKFQKTKDASVPLGFNFPTGSAAPVTALNNVAEGVFPSAGELDSMQKRALTRGVMLATCRAVGASNDTAKALEIFRAADPQVPRATFVAAMANSLYEESELYGRMQIGDSEKFNIFCNQALDGLKSIPETADTKGLRSKIESALKIKKKG